MNNWDDKIPSDKAERLEWLKTKWGFERESLERCEYGGKVDKNVARKLFPFAEINFRFKTVIPLFSII